MNSKNGFTLIEIMIVVVVLSVLSGITISALNQNRARDRARDTVILANLEKATSAIESHFYSEGDYPLPYESGNPLDNNQNTVLSTYLQTWPDGLMYITNAENSGFAVYAKRNLNDNYYKYSSTSNEIQECSGENENVTSDINVCDVVTN